MQENYNTPAPKCQVYKKARGRSRFAVRALPKKTFFALVNNSLRFFLAQKVEKSK